MMVENKKAVNIRFYSQPIYDENYIKTKVKAFNNVINTVFLNNKIPKEKNHYTCITTTNIESIMKIDKKNYPEVYLEQWKYKIKKKKLIDFIDAAFDLDSDDYDDSE